MVETFPVNFKIVLLYKIIIIIMEYSAYNFAFQRHNWVQDYTTQFTWDCKHESC